MKRFVDKILTDNGGEYVIGAIYLLLMVSFEYFAYHLFDIYGENFLTVSFLVVAPLIGVTFGAIAFRAILIGICWLIDVPLTWSANGHMSETCLILLFICSLLPLVIDRHVDTFLLLGGLLGFTSTKMVVHFDKPNKADTASLLYQFLAVIIVFIGALGGILVFNNHVGSYNNLQLFVSTYSGGLVGLMIGGFIIGISEQGKEYK